MNQEQISQAQKKALLTILVDQISPGDFRRIVYSILGPGTYDNLSGNTHQEKCTDFMEVLYQRESEFLLPAQLAEIRSDLDLSAFGVEVTPEPMPQEPEPAPFFLPFENRKPEWEKVVLYPTGQYYLFDAPAGYGKTALLERIQEVFEERNWLNAYISSKKYQTSMEVFLRLTEELGIACKFNPNNDRQAGLEIGKAVAEQWEEHKGEEKPQGLVLLFDVDGDSQASFMPTLQKLLEEVIPGIRDGLTRNSRFFRSIPKSYRVVVAGRYLAVKIQEFDLKFQFDVNQLRPFCYQVTRNVCTRFIEHGLVVDEAESDDFAAHLLFHSGGHPRCMARILKLFTTSGYPPVDFFKFHRNAIERIAHEEADWVRWSIQRDWRKTFDALCIYRRFDYALLGKFLEQDLIWYGLVDDEFDLVTKLKQSYLVEWTGESFRHLSDGITRRLLVLHQKSDGPAEFRAACEQAQRFYTEHMKEFLESKHFWILEVLFEWLQARVASIDGLQQRRALRQQFLDDELPTMLHLLVKNRDPRFERDPLLRVLERDWELRFVINYYLRDEVYTDDVYQETLKRIKAFFAQASEQRGK